jgi:Flp pilus assembly CpaE family ATPase
VILVGEQSITSIRTLKLILDSLSKAAGSPKYQVVMNRYSAGVQGLSARELEKVLALATIHTIPDDRPAVLAAANEGKLLRLVAPRSPVLAAIDSLVSSLLEETTNGRPASGTSLMYRLFHAFTR